MSKFESIKCKSMRFQHVLVLKKSCLDTNPSPRGRIIETLLPLTSNRQLVIITFGRRAFRWVMGKVRKVMGSCYHMLAVIHLRRASYCRFIQFPTILWFAALVLTYSCTLMANYLQKLSSFNSPESLKLSSFRPPDSLLLAQKSFAALIWFFWIVCSWILIQTLG